MLNIYLCSKNISDAKSLVSCFPKVFLSLHFLPAWEGMEESCSLSVLGPVHWVFYPMEFGHGKASQANGWHWWSIWEPGKNFCFQFGFQKRQKAKSFRITYSNPFSHLYLRLTQKWPLLSPADGLAIKHTAAHTWHSSISARQPPQSRSHLYVFGAGM